VGARVALARVGEGVPIVSICTVMSRPRPPCSVTMPYFGLRRIDLSRARVIPGRLRHSDIMHMASPAAPTMSSLKSRFIPVMSDAWTQVTAREWGGARGRYCTAQGSRSTPLGCPDVHPHLARSTRAVLRGRRRVRLDARARDASEVERTRREGECRRRGRASERGTRREAASPALCVCVVSVGWPAS
jgi:hypothetical protein